MTLISAHKHCFTSLPLPLYRYLSNGKVGEMLNIYNSSTTISINSLPLHVCIASVPLNSLDNIYCTFGKLFFIHYLYRYLQFQQEWPGYILSRTNFVNLSTISLCTIQEGNIFSEQSKLMDNNNNNRFGAICNNMRFCNTRNCSCFVINIIFVFHKYMKTSLWLSMMSLVPLL